MKAMYKGIDLNFGFWKNYKGFDIQYDVYGQNEWTVQWCGDDFWFDTIGDAKAFIDDVCNE